MSGRSARRFSNVKLTQKFHSRYMGLWIFVSITLTIALAFTAYSLAQEKWGALASSQYQELSFLQNGLAVGVMGISVIFIAAFYALAVTTAHRIAGPYIKLESVCAHLRDGKQNIRLQFRKGDGLESLEATFNAMIDALQQAPPPDQDS